MLRPGTRPSFLYLHHQAIQLLWDIILDCTGVICTQVFIQITFILSIETLVSCKICHIFIRICLCDTSPELRCLIFASLALRWGKLASKCKFPFNDPKLPNHKTSFFNFLDPLCLLSLQSLSVLSKLIYWFIHQGSGSARSHFMPQSRH